LAVFLAAFLALFFAVFFAPVLRFLALPLRAAGRAVLRAAALREAFLALFFLPLRFGPPPRAAWARFMAAVAARFIFLRALAAPELRFLLDFAMIVPPALPRRQL
jgi:hypothetical protein